MSELRYASEATRPAEQDVIACCTQVTTVDIPWWPVKWHNMNVSTTSVTQEPNTASLRPDYAFRNESGVQDFLFRHRGLTDVLVQAAPVVKSYFPEAKLYLDVYPDPEEPGFVLLALRIATHMRYPDSRETLKRFLTLWWIPKTDEQMAADVAVGTEPV